MRLRDCRIFYLFIIGFHIPLSRANTSVRSEGSRVWCLGPSRVFTCVSDRPFVIERQVCSLNTKPQVSTTLHYTITVCCNRTAYSQHCLPASVEAWELNFFKYVQISNIWCIFLRRHVGKFCDTTCWWSRREKVLSCSFVSATVTSHLRH